MRSPASRAPRRARALLGAILGSVALAPAQGVLGKKDLTIANPTGSGSAMLPLRVHYPAQSPGGTNAPILPRPGGWPVIVFLHGFSVTGSFYDALGQHLASHGYVATMLDTAQFSVEQQAADGAAMLPALAAENARTGAFLYGALDLGRAGLCGHSMGGGNTVRILAGNPGFRAGFGFAAWETFSGYPARYAAQVTAPLGFVHGKGDGVVSWQRGSQSYYQLATGYTGWKAFYLFDWTGTHTNVAGVLLITAADQQVWARSAAVAAGFFDHWLLGDDSALDAVFGPAAQAEPRLASLSAEVRQPELWRAGTPRLGAPITLSLLAEPGPAALLVAAAAGQVATPWGTLRLDPATLAVVATGAPGGSRTLPVPLTIPSDPALVGASVPFQGAGLGAALLLTGAISLTIVP